MDRLRRLFVCSSMSATPQLTHASRRFATAGSERPFVKRGSLSYLVSSARCELLPWN